MKTAEITINVEPELTIAYRSASEEDRRKMDMLVGFQLSECLRSPESLESVMAEMRAEASRNGLTPTALDSILHG